MWRRAKEMVILGTQYAGEMKKGIFTVMHYLMPKRGILSLHSGCNVGKNDDVTLFFGLSGVITTLSCKPHGNHDIRCEQALAWLQTRKPVFLPERRAAHCISERQQHAVTCHGSRMGLQ